jgi:hypothetical protein
VLNRKVNAVCLQLMLILGDNVHERVPRAIVLWWHNYGSMESLLSMLILAEVLHVCYQLSGLGKC